MTPAQIGWLARQSDAVQDAFVAEMQPEDVLKLDASFETWAQAGQMPPASEGWRVWLMMAGRGFGKTRAGAEWIHKLAMSAPKRRIALVGATLDEAREVMVDGQSGVVAVAGRHGRRLRVSGRTISWPNGSVATLFSGDSPEGLRGPEHHFAWTDELSKWREPEAAWHNLMLGLRLGMRSRVLVTTTPKPLAIFKAIRALPDAVETGGRTDDNLSLSPHFIAAMRRTYGGTRLATQELDGKLIEDVEGSLWPRELIERCRISAPTNDPSTSFAALRRHAPGMACSNAPPHRAGEVYDRIVVGVDPPAGAGAQCDACGIVVAGRRGEALFVLADESVQGLRPEGWARAVGAAAARWKADLIVAEANNGGEMVRSCLVAAGASVRPKLVHASRGKVARAEPIALRFEAGMAWFAGVFPELEDELAGLGVGGHYEGPGRSPDRADAMVWAMTELAEGQRSMPGIRQL